MHIYGPRDVAELERSITHFDLDREMWLAARKRFVQDGRRVRAITPISGGGPTNVSGTVTELIYSNPTVGTAKNTFTTEFQINDTAGMGPIASLPAYFFYPGSSRGKALRVVARGILSTTGTPTWRWTFRLNPVVTPANPPTGPIIADQTGAMTMVASAVSNKLWEAEFDVQMATEGAAGNNSTLRGLGFINFPGAQVAVANLDIFTLFGGSASPGTVATFDHSLLNTLTVGSTCGTSSSSNSIQLLQLLMFGLN